MALKDSGVAARKGAAIYVAFVTLSVAMSLALPDSGESYPLLGALADAVGNLVPSVDSFASVSSFPVATRMFLAVEWACVPILIALISMQQGLVQPNERTLSTSSTVKIFALLAAALALFVMYPATIDVEPKDLSGGMLHERALRIVSKSKLWMGLIGSTVIFAVAYFSALVLSYVRVLLLRSRS